MAEPLATDIELEPGRPFEVRRSTARSKPGVGIRHQRREDPKMSRLLFVRQEGQRARGEGRSPGANPFYGAEHAGLPLGEWLTCLQAWAVGWREEEMRQANRTS